MSDMTGVYEIGSGTVSAAQAARDLVEMLGSDVAQARAIAEAWAHYARAFVSGEVPISATCISAGGSVKSVRVAVYDHDNATLTPVSDGCFDDLAKFVLVDDDESYEDEDDEGDYHG